MYSISYTHTRSKLVVEKTLGMDAEQCKLYDLVINATQASNLGVPMTKTGVVYREFLRAHSLMRRLARAAAVLPAISPAKDFVLLIPPAIIRPQPNRAFRILC